MANLAAFLNELFTSGELVFRSRPVPSEPDHRAALDVLRQRHREAVLDMGGQPLEFRSEVALWAGELVRQAAWFLVHLGEPAEEVERRLEMTTPTCAADHLSADLTFCYLGHVERRARARNPADPLAVRTAALLRAWPLSGVLADVAETPAPALDFHGHSGLQLMYAERLARHEKTAWFPPAYARERVELVFAELGRALPAAPEPTAQSEEHDEG